MDSFPEIVAPMWDMVNTDQQQQYNQFQDQDFFALFQKPYGAIPGNGVATNGYPTYPAGGINPQAVSNFSLPVLTPPSASEDSSPSPPSHNRQESPDQEGQDSALKRKASSEELDEEPNHKSQHTDFSADKRNGVRRKSTGSGKDETRLIKRKEQNRAAQRAFRERKEKHVKDLEDKVAELEAKNERAEHENENLRDLLTRLQGENMTLKQSSFTFSVSKDGSTPSTQFSSAATPSLSPSSSSDATSPKLTNPLDWSSLTTFDPNMLNLLDDNLSQPTATEGAMQMNFGFGNSNDSLNAPFTTIASNPMFMSFPSTFDSPGDSPASRGNGNEGDNFGFDMNAVVPWNGGNLGASTSSSSEHLFDDLFTGYLSAIGNTGSGGSSASVSPVAHHVSPSALATRASPASTNSPSVLGRDPLFSISSTPTSTESPPSLGGGCDNSGKGCPKTREEVAERIEAEGDSVFAPPIHKSNDNVLGTMIKCTGSKFPTTVKSDQNIEVLAAWRSIRADPKYKDVDINDLCHQFTNKARCDGTKVVLEPTGVTQILDSLVKPKSSPQ